MALVNVLTGALIAGLGVPLARRRVKPNRLYGVRTKETLADARVWYDVNAAGGRDLVRFGMFLVTAAVALFVVPEAWFGGAVLAFTGFVLAGAVGLAVRGVRLGKKVHAAYAARDRGNRPA